MRRYVNYVKHDLPLPLQASAFQGVHQSWLKEVALVKLCTMCYTLGTPNYTRSIFERPGLHEALIQFQTVCLGA
jgi:hypothetical protein